MAASVLMRCEHAGGAAAARTLRRLAAAFLQALGLKDAQLSVVLTTDRRIRTLNRRHRRLDEATDVLSFPAATAPRPRGQPVPLGDVVISLDTARRRARAARGRVGDELARYLAHGLLHLCGYDHHRKKDALEMLRAEQDLLGGAGLLGSPG